MKKRNIVISGYVAFLLMTIAMGGYILVDNKENLNNLGQNSSNNMTKNISSTTTILSPPTTTITLPTTTTTIQKGGGGQNRPIINKKTKKQSSSHLNIANKLSYKVIQDDPNIDISVKIINGRLDFEIDKTRKPVNFGIYTSDETKNALATKLHAKHGRVKQLFSKADIRLKPNRFNFNYKPTKKSEKLYFGDATEIIEVVNESFVSYIEELSRVNIYDENDTIIGTKISELHYNSTLKRCEGLGINCSIYPLDIVIFSNSTGNYKFGALDTTIGNNSSWYEYSIKSNYPLKQKNNFVWAYQKPDVTICSIAGSCKSYTKDYDIDLSGVSSYLTDNDNTTDAQITYNYTEFGNYYNVTTYDPIKNMNVTETFFNFSSSLLQILFKSNGSIDPSISSSISSISSGGLASYNFTKFSDSDNDISLNESSNGSIILVEANDLEGNFNVTNLSITSTHDISCGADTILLLRFEEGSGTTVFNECDDNSNGTITGHTFSTPGLVGDSKITGTNGGYITMGAGSYSFATVGLYFNSSNIAGSIQTIARRNNGNGNDALIIQSSRVAVIKEGTTTEISSTLSTGTLYFLVVTWNDTNDRFDVYINGKHDSNITTNSGTWGFDNARWLGDAYSQEIVGSADSLFLISRVLSAQEIEDMYNATKPNYIDDYANVTAQIRLSLANESVTVPVRNRTGLILEITANTSADRNTTHVFDSSGQQNHGLLVGGALHNVSGRIDNGMFFDGVDNQITFSDIDFNMNSLSWGAWFNLIGDGAGGSGLGAIINHYGPGGNGYQILYRASDDTMICGLGDGANKGTDGTIVSPPRNIWTHIMCTYDGSMLRLYLNGVLRANISTGTIGNPSNILRIGESSDVSGRFFNGSIDEVRIWNRSLTSQEVFEEWQRTYSKYQNRPIYSPPNESNLVFFASMDRYSQNLTHVYDISGNNNIGEKINNVSCGVDGFVDVGCDFDGVDDIIKAGNNSGLNFERTDNFSGSVWIKRKETGSDHVIFSRRVSANDRGYVFYITSNDVLEIVLQSTTTNRIRTGGTLKLEKNRWYHVAFSYNGSSFWDGIKLYINGIEDIETSVENTLTTTITTNGNLEIGDQSNIPLPFNGSIDQVMIWNTTLSASQVKQLYEDQALKYGSDLTFTNGQSPDNSSGRFERYNLVFNSINSYVSEYVSNITSEYDSLNATGVTVGCDGGSCIKNLSSYGLLAWLPMNETGSVVNLTSYIGSSDANWTCIATPTGEQTDPWGTTSAILFNRTNGEYCQTTNRESEFALGHNFSICFWAKYDSVNLEQFIIDGDSGVPDNDIFFRSSPIGNIEWSPKSNSVDRIIYNQTGNIGWVTGTWYHYCGMRNNTHNLLYLNGDLVGNVTTTADQHSALLISIAKQEASTAHKFNGTLADISFWERTLSPQEVTCLYNGTNCPNIDLTNPNVSILKPTLNSQFNMSDLLEISANVSDNKQVNFVVANITLPNGTNEKLFLNGSQNKYNGSYIIPSIAGNYHIRILANDTVGNANNSETTNFSVQNRNIGLDFAGGTEINNTIISRNWIYVNVSVTDPDSDESNITFFLFNSTKNMLNNSIFTDKTRNVNFTELDDGKYYYNVSINDKNGAKNSTKTRQILLDTISPTITLFTPINGTNFTTSTVNFYYNVTDSDAVNNCSLYINNTLDQTSTSIINAGNNTFQKASLENGNHSWFISCFDNAGNIANSTHSVFNINVVSTSGGSPTISGGGGGGASGFSRTSQCKQIAILYNTCYTYDPLKSICMQGCDIGFNCNKETLTCERITSINLSKLESITINPFQNAATYFKAMGIKLLKFMGFKDINPTLTVVGDKTKTVDVDTVINTKKFNPIENVKTYVKKTDKRVILLFFILITFGFLVSVGWANAIISPITKVVMGIYKGFMALSSTQKIIIIALIILLALRYSFRVI